MGIVTGFIVVYGLLSGKRLDLWTAIFLIFSVLTSLTGFLFPFTHVLPSHVVGILSLSVLAIAIFARYARHFDGSWRRTYVICAMIALCLNVFVLVVQSFERVPILRALAPTQKEPHFLIAQFGVMAVFILLTIFAVKKFKVLPLGNAVR